jgi:hypothetical protein
MFPFKLIPIVTQTSQYKAKHRLLLIRSLFFLCLLLCLYACSPTFDWRSTRFNTHGDAYTLTFPGKALTAQRTVTLNKESHLLTLNGVQVDSVQFVLGHVPAKNPAIAKELATALAQAFDQNLALKGTAVALKLAPTIEGFDVNYPKGQRFAQARFFWTEHAAYEILVVGNTQDLPPEVADTFIRSIKFE